MDTYSVLIYIGCILSAVTIVLAVMRTRHKIDSRTRLVRVLSHNPEFLEELKSMRRKMKNDELLRKEITVIEEMIHRQLLELDESDRARIESSVYQPSREGRKRFVEKLASDVSQNAGAPWTAPLVNH
jgi:hypothetical protein